MFGRNFALSFLCNVCVISNLVFFLFFNRYLEGLGASETQIGFYMGALAFGSVVVRPLVGTAVDKYGRKRLICFGISLMLLSTGAYFFCRELNWPILAVRVCHGVGFGCYITGIFTLVVDDAPVTRRAKVIGVFGLSGMGTYAVFPIVAEFIINHSDFNALFAAGLLTLACGLTVSNFLKEHGPIRLEFPAVGFISLLKQVDLLIPAGALFFFCTGSGALVSFIAIYLGRMNISISYFFVASSTAGVITRLYLGDLADSYGPRRVALPSFISGTIALLWLGLFHYRWELLFIGLLWGTGIGFAVPAVASAIVERVKPQDRGKGLALFTASFDLGVTAGSFAYGAVARQIGYSNMYLVGAGVALIAVIIARFFKN